MLIILGRIQILLIAASLMLSANLCAKNTVLLLPNVFQLCGDSCIQFNCKVISDSISEGAENEENTLGIELDSTNIRYEWSTGDTVKRPLICINSATTIVVEAFNKISRTSYGKDSISITFIAKPALTDTPNTRIICVDSCTVLNGPVGINYQWYENNILIDSGTSLLACPDTFTEYIVRYSFFQCIFSDTFLININDSCTKIEDTNTNLYPTASYQPEIYPNPAKDYLIIRFNQDVLHGNISILNLQGEIVFTQQFSNNLNKYAINDLTSGIYHIYIEFDGYRTSYRIIKK